MELEYWWEMPNKWTFQQPKLLKFIYKYMGTRNRVLFPFAGITRLYDLLGNDYVYNDINKDIKANFHIDAYELKDCYTAETFDVIIADPPYTHYQAIVNYNNKRLQKITRWRQTADYLLKKGGIYIELGYNSTGLVKKIAEKIALGICCNGGSHNDILILIQKKR